jgi:hypothetical protein
MSPKQPKTRTGEQSNTPITPDRPKKDEIHEDQLDKVTGGIGSQSSGAGAGKVNFNPFSITRK